MPLSVRLPVCQEITEKSKMETLSSGEKTHILGAIEHYFRITKNKTQITL